MHRIRLHGPWDVTPPDGGSPRSEKMPQEWRALFGDTPGLARFGRSFHCPTNLEPGEKVWLHLAGVRSRGVVSLNGHLIQVLTPDAADQVEIDLTPMLQPRNRLEIELEFDPLATTATGGLFGDIALLIGHR